jgi:hypothetical protein
LAGIHLFADLGDLDLPVELLESRVARSRWNFPPKYDFVTIHAESWPRHSRCHSLYSTYSSTRRRWTLQDTRPPGEH